MVTTTITYKGQITLVKRIREALHLKPWDRLRVKVSGNAVMLYPMRKSMLELGGAVPSRSLTTDPEKIAKKKGALQILREGLG